MENNKPKKTLKEKWLMLRDQIRKPILLVLALLPVLGLMLYALPFPMLNLWDLFVEQVFGNFWIAIFFIGLIFFVILMMGGISYYTVIIFMLYYFLAMALGYGYPLLTVPVAAMSTTYLIYQVFRVLENK